MLVYCCLNRRHYQIGQQQSELFQQTLIRDPTQCLEEYVLTLWHSERDGHQSQGARIRIAQTAFW